MGFSERKYGAFLSNSILLLIILWIPYFLSGLLWCSVKIRKGFDDLRILGLDFHVNGFILMLILMQILCVLLIHAEVDNSFNALILGHD